MLIKAYFCTNMSFFYFEILKGGRAHPIGSELGYSTELAKCTIFGQSLFN